ncbi:peptidase [Clostridium sp. chh4-2]|uniref:slipin family protein n=1 Tax=Clostridium sp. chh4-2 TaxID=2067550 RepID=UPI000CCECCD4|nr:slipin family protein [Clostridium sp. chh4-2]PNV59943.1 peptidase [Clostridium sp. chh4-2]
MKYIINQTQCGFLLKDGSYVKMLSNGKHNYIKSLGYEVIVEEMNGPVKFSKIPKAVLLQDPEFSKQVLHIQIPDGFLGLLYLNGNLNGVLTEKEYLFWNVWEKYEYRLLDMRETVMDKEVTKQYLSYIPLKYYKKIEIQPGETGLLYLDNQYTDELTSGTHYYWLYSKDVLCRIVDLKTKELDITGQEILTADRIGIRINLICTYRIANPRKMVDTIKGLENQLYSCAQLIIREYIGRYRLDELLEQKEEISGYIYQRLKEEQDRNCVEFLSAGIKDIILPGEIREILNTVLIAEKKAQANVITRREEVASTRSLLNTAKLMDENKTLYKLKEMECLERICTQVGNINVAGSGTLLEQLNNLMG